MISFVTCLSFRRNGGSFFFPNARFPPCVVFTLHSVMKIDFLFFLSFFFPLPHAVNIYRRPPSKKLITQEPNERTLGEDKGGGEGRNRERPFTRNEKRVYRMKMIRRSKQQEKVQEREKGADEIN